MRENYPNILKIWPNKGNEIFRLMDLKWLLKILIFLQLDFHIINLWDNKKALLNRRFFTIFMGRTYIRHATLLKIICMVGAVLRILQNVSESYPAEQLPLKIKTP